MALLVGAAIGLLVIAVVVARTVVVVRRDHVDAIAAQSLGGPGVLPDPPAPAAGRPRGR